MLQKKNLWRNPCLLLRFDIEMVKDLSKGMNRRVVYKEIDHTADLRIEIYGTDISDLFHNAVTTLYELLNISASSSFSDRGIQVAETLTIEGHDTEDLLIRLLGEFLYMAVEEKKIFLVKQIILTSSIQQEQDDLVLASLTGSWCLLSKDEIAEMKEIKAVTYHGLSIQQSHQGVTATVIMDT